MRMSQFRFIPDRFWIWVVGKSSKFSVGMEINERIVQTELARFDRTAGQHQSQTLVSFFALFHIASANMFARVQKEDTGHEVDIRSKTGPYPCLPSEEVSMPLFPETDIEEQISSLTARWMIPVTTTNITGTIRCIFIFENWK